MADLGKLVDLVKRLRGPGGCPWDQEQELADLRAYLLEECHEAAAALDRVVAADPHRASNAAKTADDAAPWDTAPWDTAPWNAAPWDELAGELGDLLFQVAFILRLGEEAGTLDASRVIDRVHTKMVTRHPHVFPPADDQGGGETEELEDVAAVQRAWERRKLARGESKSLLGGVPDSLPALLAAYRLTQKAAGVGFDWPDEESVLAKVDEELAEVRAELEVGDRQAAAREVGDLLFSVANLARKLGSDPEAMLAATNGKFRRRFSAIEASLQERGQRLEETDLETLDAFWDAAKAEEP